MMIEHDIPPNMRVIDETLLYPVTPSGLTENQSAIVRYRHPETKEPTLKLVDYIYDYNGNYIAPGLYELALSDDKEFLLLIETNKLIAVIPVFKLAQNEAELQKMQEREKAKNKKHKSWRQKHKESLQRTLRRKYALENITPPDEYYTYMNATIEYIEDGGYYLIMYENGAFRAWGAIKARNMFRKNPPQLKEN